MSDSERETAARLALSMVNLLGDLDDLERQSDENAIAHRARTSWAAEHDDLGYGEEALSVSSFFLGAALNSMRSLSLLMLRPSVDGLTINVTVNGSAGLLRQSLECAVKAKWLINARSIEELRIRGFAATWEDATEAMRYARALGTSDVEAREQSLEALVSDGRALDLLVPRDGRNPPWAPRHSMQDVASLLRAEAIPPHLLAGTEGMLGQGSANGEWLYRWLSGMAHGLPWVHTGTEVGPSAGTVQAVLTQPDWLRMALSAHLAMRIIVDGVALSGREA